jgi:hypothetical protein
LSSPEVIDARYAGDYRVWVRFRDGAEGVVDLEDDLWGEEHEALRNRDVFSRFTLDPGLATLSWGNGIELDPEFLYEKLKRVH